MLEKEIREIEKPKPSIFYKETQTNDTDKQRVLQVDGENLKEVKEAFRELKKELFD